MKRILVLCTLMLGFLVISASSTIGVQPAHAQAQAQAKSAPTMESCEATCRKCQKVCEDTLAYCQKKGGKHACVFR